MTKFIEVIKAEALGPLRQELQDSVDLAGLSASASIDARTRSEAAADRAEDAYDAIVNSGALQSAGIFETIEDGLAAVGDGDYFWVYPNELNSIDNLTLFKRVDAMTEELLFVQYNLNAFMIEEGANWETGL